MKKILTILFSIVSLLLFIGAVGLLVFATPVFGNKTLIVRSGSMEPAISVGDVVVVRPHAANYQEGDIISFTAGPEQQTVITHRIVGVTDSTEGKVYKTKGDANEAPDEFTITQKQVLGRTLFTVPYVGTLLAFAKTKLGFALLVVVPTLIVIGSEAIVITREFRGKRKKGVKQSKTVVPEPVLTIEPAQSSPVIATTRRAPPIFSPLIHPETLPPPTWQAERAHLAIDRRRATFDSVLKVSVVLFIALLGISPTYARYSDTAQSTANVFTAAASFDGIPDVVINEVMWMGSAGNTSDEWIELRNTTENPVNLNGWTIEGAGSGTAAISLSGTIQSNGYFLIANFTSDNSAINNSIGVDDDNTSLSLRNEDGGEQLTLKNGAITIDQTTTTWPAGLNDTNKQSMERNGTPGDGTVAGNWHTCTHESCNDGVYWDTAEGLNYGTPKSNNSAP